MSHAEHAYYMRRADAERIQAERAVAPEARVAHQELCALYLGRAATLADRSDRPVRSHGAS